MGEVSNSHRLAAVLGTHPVAIGQIDADGGRRIEVTTENSGLDNLGRNALDLVLLELGCYGRIALEPLVSREQLSVYWHV